ncbi:MAG TPA: hypothetical protein VD966_01310 [Pyrinomonadaceae bacterium]|nr:hypothetical protein [Pyrinomonadaceae bacterium]
MRINRHVKVIAAFVLLFVLAPCAMEAQAASDEAEVRAVVRRVFEQLKSGQYGALYDALPAASRSRISRERFKNALERNEDMYKLDRLEISSVRVSGDLAVVDTVMYGRVLRPTVSEGKIIAQQYLVREGGKWRVATGERSTVQRLLAANPRFAQKFNVRAPRIYIKRDGNWIDVSSLTRSSRRTSK